MSVTQFWNGSVPNEATVVVKRVEGFYSRPYDDNGELPGGTWTIGYGSIKDGNNQPVSSKTPPIDEFTAEQWLIRDMTGAAIEVKERVLPSLYEHEAAALISWTYNLGAGNLQKSTMLTRLNAGLKSDVPSEMRKWIYHEGTPLVGLLRRRWAEAAIFLGVDPIVSCIRAWKEIVSLDDWPQF